MGRRTDCGKKVRVLRHCSFASEFSRPISCTICEGKPLCYGLLGGFPISPGRCLHGVEGRAVYTETGVGVGLVILVQITDVLLENLHPYFTVMVQYILQVVLLIW